LSEEKYENERGSVAAELNDFGGDVCILFVPVRRRRRRHLVNEPRPVRDQRDQSLRARVGVTLALGKKWMRFFCGVTNLIDGPARRVVLLLLRRRRERLQRRKRGSPRSPFWR